MRDGESLLIFCQPLSQESKATSQWSRNVFRDLLQEKALNNNHKTTRREHATKKTRRKTNIPQSKTHNTFSNKPKTKRT